MTKPIDEMQRIGVLGPGTMGSGIALLGLRADLQVALFDISPEMLEKARAYLQKYLERKGDGAKISNLKTTTSLSDLHNCDALIEAAPEKLDLKQRIFKELDEVCGKNAIFATNTSTLSVTEIASAISQPERLAGMHFFNPAPVLPLIEVIKGARTSAETMEFCIALSKKMGKTPVVTKDTSGFIVNRVARPFYGEALRVVSENIATHEQVDDVMRLGGGFRMGPFQLMDLIGIDVNFTVMKSMFEQTFGDPRYKPSLVQLQKIQEGALGRKTGRGFYDYKDDFSEEQELDKNESPSFDGLVYVSDGSWAPGVRQMCLEKNVRLADNANELVDIAIVRGGRSKELQALLRRLAKYLSPETVLLCQTSDITLHELATWVRRPERLVGFDGLFLAKGSAATLTPSPALRPEHRKVVENFMTGVGKKSVWIDDGPGLILPRTIAMLANEAAFAIGERIADAEMIDKAMMLGVNYPKGPWQWAGEIGFNRILDILDHLYQEYREERYRAAPLLRRLVRSEKFMPTSR